MKIIHFPHIDDRLSRCLCSTINKFKILKNQSIHAAVFWYASMLTSSSKRTKVTESLIPTASSLPYENRNQIWTAIFIHDLLISRILNKQQKQIHFSRLTKPSELMLKIQNKSLKVAWFKDPLYIIKNHQNSLILLLSILHWWSWGGGVSVHDSLISRSRERIPQENKKPVCLQVLVPMKPSFWLNG